MAESITQNEVNAPESGDEDENPSRPWPVEKDAIHKWVQDRRKKSESHLSEWYEDAVTDFQFREGRQWSEEDVDRMANEERIAATFNRIGPIIQAILGQEVSNRQEVRYLPRRISMKGPDGRPLKQLADPMNDAVKWVREGCNAEDEDSDAFADMVTCGMGWTITRMDYEEDPDGKPEVIRRDPMLMRWDFSARRKNLADMKWCQADYWMTEEAIEDRWPEADLDGSTNLSAPIERLKPHDATEAWKYKNNAAGKDRYNDELRVIHHVQAFVMTMYRMIDPATGQMREYDKATYERMKKTAQDAGVVMPECVPIGHRVYWQAWTVGDVVLESGEAPAQKAFPYQCMTCYRERETGYWYGVVRMMRDPQRYANRLMSLMMSILATGAKGGMLYETGAFVNPKKAKSDWAKHNSAIEMTPGALANGKVQPKPPQAMPPAAADLMQFAIASIRDVTGVNVDMLGGADRNQPGIVEDMRTKSGLTILAGVFDAIRLYRKRQGVLLAEFVQRFISDGRLIRVLGQDGEQFIPLLRDPDGVEYDVVVDESPASRDVKERTWQALQVMVPMAMQAGMPMPPSLLDYAPLPQSLAMEWKEAIASQQSQPPQPPPQVQIAQMKIAADQQSMQGKAQGEQMKMQAQMAADQAKAQAQQMVEAAQMQADMQVERMKAEMTAQTDRLRNEMESQRATMALQQQLQLESIKASTQQQTAIILAHINAASRIESSRVAARQSDGALAYANEAAQAQ